MDREWRVISWAHNYEVSNYGEVRNFNTKRELKLFRSKGKYTLTVMIYNDKGEKACSTVGKLVAEAFIPNPDNLPYVRHLNGEGNRVDNLAWCDRDEIQSNSDRIYKTIPVMCVETGKIYDSYKQCISDIGFSYETLSRCIKDPNRTHKGLHFVKVS